MPRARKSIVALSAADSHSEDEQEPEAFAEDSGEDWKPEEKKGKAGKGKRRQQSAPVTPKGRGGKKSKKIESEESDDEVDDEVESDDDVNEENVKKTDKKSKVTVGRNQPDKNGVFELNMFKNDLTKEFRNDEKLCMWRRDGASLLQKYMVVIDESSNGNIIFKASSVYSCWEEKRRHDFFQIEVKVVGDKKESKVKVLDVAEFERLALEDRPKIDITPRGAIGGENYEENSEDDYEENDDEDD
ncbi:uncharacterized protein LOC129567443 [Sitodiplosis mosellana]|uniref:uncharacterized protein LOC129567443 n=1 Tax=Sitodiplosis mosellana TaxID=263140 RepID=UPI0024449932|nr:uncharacterized protein LOC129567443 [Sitodiplosis mosellana]